MMMIGQAALAWMLCFAHRQAVSQGSAYMPALEVDSQRG